jgi:HEAT repeat protein
MKKLRTRNSFLEIVLILSACSGVAAQTERSTPATEFQLPAHPPVGSCEKPIDTLIAILKSDDDRNHWIAAECLGEARDSRAVEALVHAVLVEKEIHTAMIERDALRKINDPRTGDLLLEALDAKQTRWTAALTLGELQITRAVDPLIMMLKSDDKQARRAAAISLGPMQDPRAIDALIGAFAERDEVLRRYVATSLGEIGDARAVDALIKALADPDEAVEWNAIASLGEVKDARAIFPLTKVLNNLDEQVRSRTEAADALAKIGDAAAVNALIEAAMAEDNSVKRHAAKALDSMDHPAATQFLTESLSQGRIAVVAGAYRYFVQKGDSSTESALVEALQKFGDEDMAVDFLYCGNSTLAEAAHHWFSKMGYEEPEQPEQKFMIWGSKS